MQIIWPEVKELRDVKDTSHTSYKFVTEIIDRRRNYREEIPDGVRVEEDHLYSRKEYIEDTIQYNKERNTTWYNDQLDSCFGDENAVRAMLSALIEYDFQHERNLKINGKYNLVSLWVSKDGKYDEHNQMHAAKYGCALDKTNVPTKGIQKYPELSGIAQEIKEARVSEKKVNKLPTKPVVFVDGERHDFKSFIECTNWLLENNLYISNAREITYDKQVFDNIYCQLCQASKDAWEAGDVKNLYETLENHKVTCTRTF